MGAWIVAKVGKAKKDDIPHIHCTYDRVAKGGRIPFWRPPYK